VAKKKEADPYSDLKDTVKTAISTAFLTKAKHFAEDLKEKVTTYVQDLQQKFVESMLAMLLLFLGAVFLLIGLVIGINNHFDLEAQWGFLIMGALIIFLSMLFKG